MNQHNATELTTYAWEKLFPLLKEAVTHDEAWLDSYMSDIGLMESYFHGSLDRFALLTLTLANHLQAGSRILDAGAGYGIQSAVLKEAGFDVSASDIYDFLPVFEPLNIDYKRWHLEADPAPYDNNSFDAVMLSQTIEHFTYTPREPLEELLRITKPGGYLLIDAPNISSFNNISRLLRGKTIMWNMKKHYLQQEPMITHGIPYFDRHNHELSMEDMKGIADHYDLEIIDARYYSPYNKQKTPASLLFARIRDLVPHWRKGLYTLMRKPI